MAPKDRKRIAYPAHPRDEAVQLNLQFCGTFAKQTNISSVRKTDACEHLPRSQALRRLSWTSSSMYVPMELLKLYSLRRLSRTSTPAARSVEATRLLRRNSFLDVATCTQCFNPRQAIRPTFTQTQP